MKVLFLIDGLLKGGKERQFVQLIHKLIDKKKIDIQIVVMNNNIEYEQLLKLDIKMHFLIRKRKKDITIFWKLFKIYKLFKPDIIHTFDSMTTFYSIPITLLTKSNHDNISSAVAHFFTCI